MKLTLTPELYTLLATNGHVEDLATEILAQKEPLAVAQYLLTQEVALELLVAQLKADPTGTFKALEAMPDRTRSLPRKSKRGRPKKNTQKAVKKPTRRRKRLSKTQVDRMKQRILVLLKKGPAGRKEIMEGAKVPTAGAYNRVMGELREAREVKVKGERRSTVYSLR